MTTQTQSLSDWLLAQLAADEAVAGAAASPGFSEWKTHEWQPPDDKPEMITRWQVVSAAEEWGSHEAQFVEAFVSFPYGDERRVVEHIAANDPAHVLATVAAHRAIVEEFLDVENTLLGLEEEGDWEAATGWVDRKQALDFAIRALASIYADRDGFVEAWR